MSSRFVLGFNGAHHEDFDTGVKPGAPHTLGCWHEYVRTAPNKDDIRYLRIVTSRGDVSHQPIGTFAFLPDGFPAHLPVFAHRGTPKQGAWGYKAVNAAVDQSTGQYVPAVNTPAQEPVEEVLPSQPALADDKTASPTVLAVEHVVVSETVEAALEPVYYTQLVIRKASGKFRVSYKPADGSEKPDATLYTKSGSGKGTKYHPVHLAIAQS